MIFIEKLLGQRAPYSNPYVFYTVRIFFYFQAIKLFHCPHSFGTILLYSDFLGTFLGTENYFLGTCSF